MARKPTKRTPKPKAAPKSREARGGEPDPLGDLTYKQRLFIEAYLGEANGNATEAARVAGYAWPDKVGIQLLAKTSIRAAIDARLDEAALSASEILARLSEMAAGSIEHFLTVDTKGGYRVDFAKAKRLGKLHLIKKIKPTRYGVSVELHDQQAALEKLGKFRGLWEAKESGGGEAVEAFVRAVQQIAEKGRQERVLEPPQ